MLEEAGLLGHVQLEILFNSFIARSHLEALDELAREHSSLRSAAVSCVDAFVGLTSDEKKKFCR